jgi:hypothetical protein
LSTEKKAFVETSFCTIVLIDVHDTSHLKLKLPERDVLIQGEGLDLIWRTVEMLYCRMISNSAIVNGLPADHPLRATSPYPIPRPACVVSNLAGTRWMPVEGGLISADGNHLERYEIVSVVLELMGSRKAAIWSPCWRTLSETTAVRPSPGPCSRAGGSNRRLERLSFPMSSATLL